MDSILKLLVLWMVIHLSTAYISPSGRYHCDPMMCQPPDCVCASLDHPPGMHITKVPQMVMFTFDDNLNQEKFQYYKHLLYPELHNPNGCPIRFTYFVADQWTDYQLVHELHQQGHEFGSHTMQHSEKYMDETWYTQAEPQVAYKEMVKEFHGQRQIIINNASVPRAEVRGLRMPYLALGRNAQFKMMKDYDFLYDSSFMVDESVKGPIWPYTLDVPPSYPEMCKSVNCPTDGHPGVWEMSMNNFWGAAGQRCVMVDVPHCQPNSKQEALDYLWNNFRLHYKSKCPFGVHMHYLWLTKPHNLMAVREFIEGLVNMNDVYVVTMYQVIQWMRQPQALDMLRDWEPWKTACNSSKGTQTFAALPEVEQLHAPPAANQDILQAEVSEKGNTMHGKLFKTFFWYSIGIALFLAFYRLCLLKVIRYYLL